MTPSSKVLHQLIVYKMNIWSYFCCKIKTSTTKDDFQEFYFSVWVLQTTVFLGSVPWAGLVWLHFIVSQVHETAHRPQYPLPHSLLHYFNAWNSALKQSLL